VGGGLEICSGEFEKSLPRLPRSGRQSAFRQEDGSMGGHAASYSVVSGVYPHPAPSPVHPSPYDISRVNPEETTEISIGSTEFPCLPSWLALRDVRKKSCDHVE
jgi:hypothetical protein